MSYVPVANMSPVATKAPEAFSLVLASTPPGGSETMSSQNKWETFWRSRGHGGHMCTRSNKDGVELPPSFYFEKENLLTPQDFMKISIKCPFERNLLCNWNGEGNVKELVIRPAVWLALLKWFILVFRATLILFFCLKSTLNYLWKSQIGCALALANFSFCQSSGPMAQHYCLGITMAYIRCYIPLFGRYRLGFTILESESPIFVLKKTLDVWKWLFHGNSVGP